MDSEDIVELDAEIDAYNQGKLKDRALGPRSRNLGKKMTCGLQLQRVL